MHWIHVLRTSIHTVMTHFLLAPITVGSACVVSFNLFRQTLAYDILATLLLSNGLQKLIAMHILPYDCTCNASYIQDTV